MKKFWLLVIFLICSFNAFAQNNQTYSSHSIKGPLIGLSYSYEHPIAQLSTLNFELILNGGFGSSSFHDSYWYIAPGLRVEPRFYYNLIFRYEKGKKTINNSANYLALALDYQPNLGIGRNAEPNQFLAIVPKYGLKRTIGRHFIFEIAAGYGTYIAQGYDWNGVFAYDIMLGYAF